ncbi:MAG: adenosylmethionine decarboxylase [Candidatus Bathyarchaeota archaeon]|nr:adenosylmethionine decarboxylase [Candidatus Bathyarchaeota archaeon]
MGSNELKQIREILADLYDCESDLENLEFLVNALRTASEKMGSTVVKTISHKFSPTGITVFMILAETHMSIHTWPEHKYAALDIFICNEEIDPEIGWNVVKDVLKPSSFKMQKMIRNIP